MQIDMRKETIPKADQFTVENFIEILRAAKTLSPNDTCAKAILLAYNAGYNKRMEREKTGSRRTATEAQQCRS